MGDDNYISILFTGDGGMLCRVYKINNGMVFCTDERGRSIPELQGAYEVVKNKVLEAALPYTEFYHVIWGSKNNRVSKEDW